VGAFGTESQLSLLLERRLDTEEQSQKYLLLKWRQLLLSHWADYYKPQARPTLSRRGSGLVKLPIENCFQRTLFFVFTVPSTKSYCQLWASQAGGFSSCL